MITRDQVFQMISTAKLILSKPSMMNPRSVRTQVNGAQNSATAKKPTVQTVEILNDDDIKKLQVLENAVWTTAMLMHAGIPIRESVERNRTPQVIFLRQFGRGEDLFVSPTPVQYESAWMTVRDLALTNFAYNIILGRFQSWGYENNSSIYANIDPEVLKTMIAKLAVYVQDNCRSDGHIQKAYRPRKRKFTSVT